MAISSAQANFGMSAAGTATRPLISGTLTLGQPSQAMRFPLADIAFTGLAVLSDTQVATVPFDDLIATPATSASVAATATLTSTGTDNNILLTAIATGATGNTYSVALVDPAANDAALTVTTANNLLFTVSLATGGAGAITSTASAVIAALNALPAFAALMVAANSPANDGTGVVMAIAATSLTGGIKKQWDGAALDFEGESFDAPDEILGVLIHCKSGAATILIDAMSVVVAAGEKLQLGNPAGIFDTTETLTITSSANDTEIEVALIAKTA